MTAAPAILASAAGAALGALAAGIVLLVTLPSPARTAARVTGLFLLVLSPVIAVGYGYSFAHRDEPLAWLALVPLTITWLAILDLRWGVSGRVTKGLPKGATKKPAPKPSDLPGGSA